MLLTWTGSLATKSDGRNWAVVLRKQTVSGPLLQIISFRGSDGSRTQCVAHRFPIVGSLGRCGFSTSRIHSYCSTDSTQKYICIPAERFQSKEKKKHDIHYSRNSPSKTATAPLNMYSLIRRSNKVRASIAPYQTCWLGVSTWPLSKPPRERLQFSFSHKTPVASAAGMKRLDGRLLPRQQKLASGAWRTTATMAGQGMIHYSICQFLCLRRFPLSAIDIT